MKRQLKWAMLAISCGLLMASQQIKDAPPQGNPEAAIEKGGPPTSQVMAGPGYFNVGGYAVAQDAQYPSIFRVSNPAGVNVATVKAYAGANNVLATDVAVSADGKLAVTEDDAVKIGTGIAHKMKWTKPDVVVRGPDFQKADGKVLARYKAQGGKTYEYYRDPVQADYLVHKNGPVDAALGVKSDPKVVARLQKEHADLGIGWSSLALPGKPVAVAEGPAKSAGWVVSQDPRAPANYGVSDTATGANLAQLSALADKNGDKTKVVAWRADPAPDSALSDADFRLMGSNLDQRLGLPASDVLVKSSKTGAANVMYRSFSDGQVYRWDPSTGELTGGKRAYVTVSGSLKPGQVALVSHGPNYTFTADPTDSATVWASANGVRLASLAQYDLAGAAASKKVMLVGVAARDPQGRAAVDASEVGDIGLAYTKRAGLNNVAILQPGKDYRASDGLLYHIYQDDAGDYYLGTPDQQALVDPRNGVYVRNAAGAVDTAKLEALKKAGFDFRASLATGKTVALVEQALLGAPFDVDKKWTVAPTETGFDVLDTGGRHVAFFKTYAAPDLKSGVVAADVTRDNTGKAPFSDQDISRVADAIAKNAGLSKYDIVQKVGSVGSFDKYHSRLTNTDYLAREQVLTDGTAVYSAPGVTADSKAAKDLQDAYRQQNPRLLKSNAQ